MVVQTRTDALQSVRFFRGLEDAELDMLGGLCRERLFKVGELVQKENEQANQVSFILEGRVGVEVQMPTRGSKEFILSTLGPGECFGWSSLIYGTPWSTLRVLEPTRVVCVKTDDLVKLCEENNRIGYVLMKNLATLISSRLRKDRVSTLNAIVAMRGEG